MATAGSATALTAVIHGGMWFGYVLLAALLVATTGGMLRLWRVPTVVVAAGQLAVLLLLITWAFAEHGIAVLVPGPEACHELATLLTTAGDQAYRELPPVAATPAMLCLVTITMGVVAFIVDTLVARGVPAVAGLPLLGVYAAPAALSDDLLPWWTFVLGAGGFAALLAVHHSHHHHARTLSRLPSDAVRPGNPATPVTILAVTLVAGLLAGSTFTGIGTAGRIPGNTSGNARPVAGGGYGIHPFTSLRGLLNRAEDVPMFEVAGLGDEQRLLRAFTLSKYEPNNGWTLPDGPMPQGVPASGKLPDPKGTEPGQRQRPIRIKPLNWNDVWLPIYGVPSDLRGLGDGWIYDADSGTVFQERSKPPNTYTEMADINRPSKQQLRDTDKNTVADSSTPSVSSDYTELAHVDARVARLAEHLTADATTRYDKARAVWEHFDPDNGFKYKLETAPATDENAMADFLFHGKRGYCEQYASTMAVMLRSLDIPSRVAVGFTTGERDGSRRTISTQDAHAWVEVYFPEVGWVSFDPTPLNDGRAFTPEYLRDESSGSESSTSDSEGSQDRQREQAEHDRDHLATPEGQDTRPTTRVGVFPAHASAWTGWACAVLAVLALAMTTAMVLLRRHVDRPPTDTTKPPQRTITRLAAWLPTITVASWSLVVLLAGWQVHWLVGVTFATLGLGAMTPAAVRETQVRRRLHTMTAGTNAPRAAWRELRDECGDRGLIITPGDTLRSIAERIGETSRLDVAGSAALYSVVGELEHAWYAPSGATSVTPQDTTLVTAFTTLRHHWARAAPLSLRAKLFPRSLLKSGNVPRPRPETR